MQCVAMMNSLKSIQPLPSLSNPAKIRFVTVSPLSYGQVMVLTVDGNSDIGAHAWREIGNLICLGCLFSRKFDLSSHARNAF